MGALALADGARLREAWEGLAAAPEYRVIRGPETGLVMVRARAGNTGRRFNLGEMTVTRCTVGLADGIMGYAWIAGIRPEHARLAALFDALMQIPHRSEEIGVTLIEPLLRDRCEHLARRADEVRPSKVDFFTLVRGED
ncbi:phosphonate C-P lyase system protein PhnG [Desulfomicrobium salsuginis]